MAEIREIRPPRPNYPGTWTRRPISRAICRDAGFPGNLDAADTGIWPLELIPIMPGMSARRRRSGAPIPARWPLARIEAAPAYPRAGAGISGPRER